MAQVKILRAKINSEGEIGSSYLNPAGNVNSVETIDYDIEIDRGDTKKEFYLSRNQRSHAPEGPFSKNSLIICHRLVQNQL